MFLYLPRRLYNTNARSKSNARTPVTNNSFVSDLISIGKIPQLTPIAELTSLLPILCQFKQAAMLMLLLPSHSPTRYQVASPYPTPTPRVVREHMSERPIHRLEPRLTRRRLVPTPRNRPRKLDIVIHRPLVVH